MKGWSFERFLQKIEDKVSPTDRELAIGFVEGFEAAPADQMSAIAVAGETLEDDEQYILPAGYDQVVNALVAELPRQNVTVITGAPCSVVAWRKNFVEVRSGRRNFGARAAIVTIPLGVWQVRRPGRGALAFEPELRAHRSVAEKMGMGHVIRLNIRFDGRRWRGLLPVPLRQRATGGFGFVHARPAQVPVWWNLQDLPVVTGWSGGPAAMKLGARSPAAIEAAALRQIADMFDMAPAVVRSAVADLATHSWTRDPYSRGAYSFTRAGQDDASERLREPMKDTLFFAGEATAEGEEVGTVHGAFSSGLRAAQEVKRVGH